MTQPKIRLDGPELTRPTFLKGRSPRDRDERAVRDSGVAEPEAFQPPPCRGPFAIGPQIGEGAHSRVHQTTDPRTGDAFCIKIPKGEAREAVLRIKREYRAVRRLGHSGIVGMHHLLRIEDRYGIVMDALPGPTLLEAVRGSTPKGKLPHLPELIHVAAELAATLAHMHAQGWLHGDLKPENVLLTPSHSPRLIDLGLATNLRRPLWTPASNQLVGTFAYLPPESIVGEPFDPSADMFSFGRMLSILVAGRLPSWDPNLGSLAADERIRQQLPPDTPANLLGLCTRLVRIAPVQRPTAAMVYEQLTGKELPPVPTPQYSTQGHSEWLAKVMAAASDVYERSASKLGSVLWIQSDAERRTDIERVLGTAPALEPRLVLGGYCDASADTPVPAFDEILDQLAVWLRQLPPSICRQWRPDEGCDALAVVAPELADALGLPTTAGYREPTARELQQGCDCIAGLLKRIAKQRTVVLVLHGVADLDPGSSELLRRLIKLTRTSPLVVAATLERGSFQPPQARSSETVQRIIAEADHRVVT